MESGKLAERRRGRRVPLHASLLLRRLDQQAPSEHTIQNVSLAGAYFETDQTDRWSLDDVVIASVLVPESQRRLFPFTRLAGRGRIVRITELSERAPNERKRAGIALEFGHDLTALTAIPARG